MASIALKILELIFSNIEDPVQQRLFGLKICSRMKF
jgi:hypothetical protein